MKQIIKKFIEGKQKTNLHAILCLKRIYVDNERPINKSFQQNEISRLWPDVAELNPSFLNAGVAPVYMTKQQFISKVDEDLFVIEKYWESFLQLPWNEIENIVIDIKPLFAPIYHTLQTNRNNFINHIINILQTQPSNIDIKLIPALLEIFAYAVLKTHLNYFGADILRWTRTNSNDGGVDMTCGDVCYSITTNLNYNKMDGDASKQVRNRLNFITIKSKIGANTVTEIEQSRGLKINIIQLNDLVKLISHFDAIQNEELINTLDKEIMKEL
jgi:hypothetical protein